MLFQFVHDHAVLIGRHGNILRPVGIPGLQSAEVGGGFDHDMVALIDKYTPDEIQGLLGAGGDQDVIGCNFDPEAVRVTGDHFPQRAIALSGAVLQCLCAEFIQYGVAGFLELLDRKNFRRR